MSILRDIKNCFAFLTRFPVSRRVNIYEEVAPKIWLFPIVGLVLGLISSFASLILLKFLPFLLVGFITLGLILLMTGGHHTDGLFDFGDGLMVMGSPERKIEVMHDVAIGAGGLTLGFIVLSLTGIAISYSMEFIIIALVLSEIGAKFSMVAACSIGKSAKTKMGDPFIRQNTLKHMIASLFLSILLIFIMLLFIESINLIYNDSIVLNSILSPVNNISAWNIVQVAYILLIFLAGTFIPLIIMMNLANRNFGGLTGDCLGALNEITRLFVLILTIIMASMSVI